MEISFLGAGSVKLGGRQITIVCDPYGESYGLGKLTTKADVVTLSSSDLVSPISASQMLIDGPGEYEVQGAFIKGIAARGYQEESGEGATIYVVEADGINTVITGNIASGLSDKQIEAIGEPDVLIIPVGNQSLTLNATEAAQLVSRLEPKIVIPVHYDDEKTTFPKPQDKLDGFLKEIGASPEPQAKLKIAPKDLPLETTVVVLKRGE